MELRARSNEVRGSRELHDNRYFYFPPQPCLVPRPKYYASVIRFGPRGPRVSHLTAPWSERGETLSPRLLYGAIRWETLGTRLRSSEMRHRNQLTVKAWEKAVQELGKPQPITVLEKLIPCAFCPSPPLCNADKIFSSYTSLHFTIFHYCKGKWAADIYFVGIRVRAVFIGVQKSNCFCTN